MAKTPVISEAEWVVMKVLWANAPLTAGEVVEKLAKDPRGQHWHPNTIKTMVRRLEKKGALRSEKIKKLYHFTPVVSEEACVQQETKSFLDRFFSGSVKPLLVHFAEREKLSEADLNELKKILKEKK